MLSTASVAQGSAHESAVLPAANRGWLLAFVIAGVVSFVVSSLASLQAVRGVVSGVALIVQLVAFSKVWRIGSGRT